MSAVAVFLAPLLLAIAGGVVAVLARAPVALGATVGFVVGLVVAVLAGKHIRAGGGDQA